MIVFTEVIPLWIKIHRETAVSFIACEIRISWARGLYVNLNTRVNLSGKGNMIFFLLQIWPCDHLSKHLFRADLV